MSSKRTAIVTGASQGIGAALVEALVNADYNVVATSRNVHRSLKASPTLVPVDGDIGKRETAAKVVAAAMQNFGRIDLLVTNAGIFSTKAFTEFTTDDFNALVSTNLLGFLYITQLVRSLLVITLTNILVATDFSAPSAAALTYGRALAGHFKSMLHVVHVVGTIPTVYGGEAYVVSVPDLQQQVEDAARKELEALPVESDELPLFRRVLITSNVPATAIVDYAKRERVGLIVAGTHGRGAVAHALIGSVAERIVRTAPCPVLTVRNPEHEFVVPDTVIANAAA